MTRAFEASIAFVNSLAFAVAADKPEPNGLKFAPPPRPPLILPPTFILGADLSALRTALLTSADSFLESTVAVTVNVAELLGIYSLDLSGPTFSAGPVLLITPNLFLLHVIL